MLIHYSAYMLKIFFQEFFLFSWQIILIKCIIILYDFYADMEKNMGEITNWEPIKAFYELLHHSPAYIAEAFDLPQELIEDVIIEKGWQHKGDADKDVHKKTAALSVLKQQYL